MTSKITSADGTTIAYDKTGSGPALLLVDGAFCHCDFGPMPALIPLLAPHYTVYSYDRRGRGESGDTLPYSPEREIEDIEALLGAIGTPAYVYGISSGAVLAARAAAALPGRVTKLALYEAPLVVNHSRKLAPADYVQQIDTMIANGRNGDAVGFFMTKMVAAPAFVPYIMRLMPAWRKLKTVAPTLRYDFAVLGDTQRGEPIPAELAEVLGVIDVPTLMADGGKSPAWMHHAADALAQAVPDAKRITLPGQNHQVKASALAPSLIEFFGSAS